MSKGINLSFKDVLYNFTRIMTMSRSNFGRPFKSTKEIDIGTVETLIEAS